MKKPLIAFLILFVVAAGFFATIGIQQINNHVAISKSPAFVLAEPQDITKKTKKSKTTFQVNYTYTVSGTTYKLDTDWMDTLPEAEAMFATPVQVAYATTAPAEGIFKSEYDARDPDEGIFGALLKALGLGLGVALVGTLIALWKFPSLRR